MYSLFKYLTHGRHSVDDPGSGGGSGDNDNSNNNSNNTAPVDTTPPPPRAGQGDTTDKGRAVETTPEFIGCPRFHPSETKPPSDMFQGENRPPSSGQRLVPPKIPSPGSGPPPATGPGNGSTIPSPKTHSNPSVDTNLQVLQGGSTTGTKRERSPVVSAGKKKSKKTRFATHQINGIDVPAQGGGKWLDRKADDWIDKLLENKGVEEEIIGVNSFLLDAGEKMREGGKLSEKQEAIIRCVSESLGTEVGTHEVSIMNVIVMKCHQHGIGFYQPKKDHDYVDKGTGGIRARYLLRSMFRLSQYTQPCYRGNVTDTTLKKEVTEDMCFTMQVYGTFLLREMLPFSDPTHQDKTRLPVAKTVAAALGKYRCHHTNRLLLKDAGHTVYFAPPTRAVLRARMELAIAAYKDRIQFLKGKGVRLGGRMGGEDAQEYVRRRLYMDNLGSDLTRAHPTPPRATPPHVEQQRNPVIDLLSDEEERTLSGGKKYFPPEGDEDGQTSRGFAPNHIESPFPPPSGQAAEEPDGGKQVSLEIVQGEIPGPAKYVGHVSTALTERYLDIQSTKSAAEIVASFGFQCLLLLDRKKLASIVHTGEGGDKYKSDAVPVIHRINDTTRGLTYHPSPGSWHKASDVLMSGKLSYPRDDHPRPGLPYGHPKVLGNTVLLSDICNVDVFFFKMHYHVHANANKYFYVLGEDDKEASKPASEFLMYFCENRRLVATYLNEYVMSYGDTGVGKNHRLMFLNYYLVSMPTGEELETERVRYLEHRQHEFAEQAQCSPILNGTNTRPVFRFVQVANAYTKSLPTFDVVANRVQPPMGARGKISAEHSAKVSAVATLKIPTHVYPDVASRTVIAQKWTNVDDDTLARWYYDTVNEKYVDLSKCEEGHKETNMLWVTEDAKMSTYLKS